MLQRRAVKLRELQEWNQCMKEERQRRYASCQRYAADIIDNQHNSIEQREADAQNRYRNFIRQRNEPVAGEDTAAGGTGCEC
jgi:hypothetical protein